MTFVRGLSEDDGSQWFVLAFHYCRLRIVESSEKRRDYIALDSRTITVSTIYSP